MKVTEETIKYVAELARLNIRDHELKRLTKDMIEIIAYVEKLNELNTDDVQPKEHVIPIYNIFRKDLSTASFDRDEILKNAPVQEDGAVKVPSIVDREES